MLQRSSITLGFAALLIATLACGPTTTDVTAPPPDTAAPAQPAAPIDTPVPAAQQYFTEEFDGDISNWTKTVLKNSDEGDTDLAKVTVADGRLVFDLDKWLLAYVFYDPYEYEDVRIDARVENRGTNVNDVLLVCRSSDEGLYLVNIANSGLFSMYAWEAASDTYTRIADGGSNSIRSGKETNDYGLVCKDKRLTLYINDKKVRDYTDNRFVFRSGKVGVGVGSENQLPVKVEFDNVTISEP